MWQIHTYFIGENHNETRKTIYFIYRCIHNGNKSNL